MNTEKDEPQVEIARYIEAKRKADSYQQQFPGDGFEHEVPTLGRMFIELPMVDVVLRCKCGNNMWFPRQHREQGEMDLIQCAHCYYWHVIIWITHKPKTP